MAEEDPKSKKGLKRKIIHDQEMAARRTIIEDMFDDYYKKRRNIYWMNFTRGIFFGLGTVIGGTIIVALVVWVLSFFVHIPGIGQTAERAQQSLQSGQQR